MIYTVRKATEKTFTAKDGNLISGYEMIAENAKGDCVRCFVSDRHDDVLPLTPGKKVDLALNKWGKMLDIFPVGEMEGGEN